MKSNSRKKTNQDQSAKNNKKTGLISRFFNEKIICLFYLLPSNNAGLKNRKQ